VQQFEDLDPWRRFADEPHEDSAFRAWVAALEASGSTVSLLGKPDLERKKYQEIYDLDEGDLTVDAHVALDGNEWFVDHTVLRGPGGQNLPAAIREAQDELRGRLAGAVLLSPTGGLRITVIPPVGMRKKKKIEYYDKLAGFGRQAAESGQRVYDPEAEDHNPIFPFPVAEPWTPRDPEDPIEFTISLPQPPVTVRLRNTAWGWGHDLDAVRAFLAESIINKLSFEKSNGRPGQLRRAASLGVPTGLLLDARAGLPPISNEPLRRRARRRHGPPVTGLPVAAVRDLMTELAAAYPGALTRAWVLSADNRVHEVYASEEAAKSGLHP